MENTPTNERDFSQPLVEFVGTHPAVPHANQVVRRVNAIAESIQHGINTPPAAPPGSIQVVYALNGGLLVALRVYSPDA